MQHADEQFSALIDDAADLPPDSLISELLDDDARRRQWARYHLIGDVLRDRQAPIDLDLAGRISAAIDTEPALLAPNALPRERPRSAAAATRAGGRPWAVAAGLAAVGVTGVLLASRMPEPAAPAAPVAAVASIQPATLATPVAAAIATAGAAAPQLVTWDTEGTPNAANPQTSEFQRRLNSYLVNFNEQRSNLGVPGVHPYVRIVGFEAEPAP